MLTAPNENSICRQTSAKIYSAVIAKNMKPGTKLMPIQDLAKKFNVSYLTAQRAVKFLQHEGVIASRRGDGTYVTGKVLDESAANAISNNLEISDIETQNKHKLHSIGVIMPYWMSDHGAAAFHKIIRGFLNGIGDRNWRIELINNVYREAALPDFVDKILQKQLAGIFWMAPQIEHQMNMMRLVDKGLLVVSVGRTFPDLPIKSLFVDLAELAQSIVQKYAQPGKKVILLTGPTDGAMQDANSIQFISSMQSELSKKGIVLNDNQIGKTAVFTSGFKADSSILRTLTLNFLRQHADAGLIICYHDEFLPIIEELDNEGFWKDPVNSRIISINAEFGLQQDHAGRIPVTMVHMPLENLGISASLEFQKEWEEPNIEYPDLKPTME